MAKAARFWNALFVFFAPLVSLSACAEVLGIQQFVTLGEDAGATADTSLDTSPDASLEGSIRADASEGAAPDAIGVTLDAIPPDAGDAGTSETAAPCTSGGSCTPTNLCYEGTNACEDGGAICSPTTALGDGTPCGSTTGFVCKSGACVACDAGADCSDPSMPCVKKTYDCRTGTAVCSIAGNVVDGTSCNGTMYCYSGSCSMCTVNASCVPTGQPCHVGKVTSCAGGTMVCTDQNMPAATGASCQTGSIASGVCDGQSNCVACTANASCSPPNSPCKSGTMSCSGGPVCNPTSNINEGKTCGSGMICVSGSCVACDATTCPNGCCGSTGCVGASVQTPSMCGSGTSGGTCQMCNGPTSGTGTAVCANDACSISCSGQTGCGTACVDLMSDTNNCGKCGQPCGTGQTCSGGQCACPSGMQYCGGKCISNTDPGNCGSCGHDCLGGSCVGGRCQPVTLAPAQQDPVGIAVDNNTGSATTVYWSNQGAQTGTSGSIMKCTIASCTPTALVPSAFQPGNLAYNNGILFWTTSDGTVNECAAASCSPTTLQSSLNVPSGLAADNTFAYYTQSYPTNLVNKCPVGQNCNSSPYQVASGQTGVAGVTVDSANIYWTNTGGSENGEIPDAGAVMKCDKVTCNGPTALMQGTPTTGAIAVDSTNVYWIQLDSGGTYSVRTCPIAQCPAGGPTLLATDDFSTGGSLAVDSSGLYWTATNTQTIKKCGLPACPGGAVTLAMGQNTPDAITLDSKAIYWTDAITNVGTVMMLAK